MAIINKISIEQYLKKVARFSNSDYGMMIRNQFKDIEAVSYTHLTLPTSDLV